MHPTVQILGSIHLAFLAYLLLQGRGLKRALEFEIAAIGLTAGVMLACLPVALFGLKWYLLFVFYLSLFALPYTMFRLNRGEALQRVSILEVVLINVLTIVVAQPFGLLALLLNPLRLGGIAGDIFGLWPSFLALLLAARGPPGDLRLRLVLGIWTHVVGILWLLPFAFRSITSFDASSGRTYVESLVACFAAVHVALVAHSLLLVFRGDRIRAGDGFAMPTQALAESVYLRRFSPLLLAGTGVLWWVAVQAWLRVAPGSVGQIAVPYVAAFVLGALMMPYRDDAPEGDPAAHRPASIAWRSYRWTFVFALLGAAPLAYMDLYSEYITWLTSHSSFWIIQGIFAVAALLVINGLLAVAWIIADAAGRPVSAPLRGLAWLGVIGIVAAFRLVTAPWPHPPGGIDGREERVDNGRVYVWYATEFGSIYRRGRAVYLEYDGGMRRRICGDADVPVEAFSIRSDRMIECHGPGGNELVDRDGNSLAGRKTVNYVQLSTSRITADEARCRVTAAAAPTVRCQDMDYPLAEQSHAPSAMVPSSVDADAAVYFRIEWGGESMDCIVAPADAVLPDGSSPGANVVILVAHTATARPFWLIDREGSCGRIYPGTYGGYFELFYTWHPQDRGHHGNLLPLNLGNGA